LGAPGTTLLAIGSSRELTNHAGQVLDDSGRRYEPPDEIGADFYPQLGPYSSLDDKVITQHLTWIAQAGVVRLLEVLLLLIIGLQGTLAVSWYRNDRSDDQLKDLPGIAAPGVARVRARLIRCRLLRPGLRKATRACKAVQTET
jgi:hypothetical protein